MRTSMCSGHIRKGTLNNNKQSLLIPCCYIFLCTLDSNAILAPVEKAEIPSFQVVP